MSLTPPARLLLPRYHCIGQPHDMRQLKIGNGDDAATVTRHDWGACKLGCHQPETYLTLEVPCDSRLCECCDCEPGHSYYLGDEAIAGLRALLS